MLGNMDGEPTSSPRESFGAISSSSPVLSSSLEQNSLKLSAGIEISGHPQPSSYLNPFSSNLLVAGPMLSSSNYSTDKLITEEETLTSSFSDLLVDVSFDDRGPKMLSQVPKEPINCPSQQIKCQQKLPVATSQVNDSVNPSSSSAARPIKHHMRWTPELHDAFVDAINMLGGVERANPKDVLKLMKVDGLTIYHVKSHIQKYRTARYMTESKEGFSDKKSTPLLDLLNLDYKGGMDITEALRLQMQVQKKLHDQLQIQRNLLLQIQKQGKFLQMMSKKHWKSDISSCKVTSEFEEEPCSNTPDAFKISHVNNHQQTLPCQDKKCGDKQPGHGISASKLAKETLFVATDKDKRPRKDDLFDQPSKLAKVYNPTTTSPDYGLRGNRSV